MDSKKTFRNAARALALALLAAGGLLHGVAARAEVVGGEGWITSGGSDRTMAAGYLVLTNNGGETAKLLRITSPLCDLVMIHRSSMDSQGAARMWPVGSLEIPAGESVRFVPDGLHVMFMELQAPLAVGQKVPLQLAFEGEPEITVMLEVKPAPDAGANRLARKDRAR